MRQNLMEAYAPQLSVAEAYVAKNFDGKHLSTNTKLTTAVLLDNTNRWITSATKMNESLATARTDLGDWKKFCLNLTNIAVPSLIANDLVIVHPMTSYSGSVAYLQYVSLTNKGGVKVGDVFNGVFGLGEMTEARQNFTAQLIVDPLAKGEKLGLEAVASGKFKDADGDVKDVKIKLADGTFKYLTAEEAKAYTAADDGEKAYYFSDEFQMEHVPAKDIPTIGPKMAHIPLVAEPRRIAVKYDQITAFQAKTDYGFSLDKQIAEQACGELSLEIDTDIVDMLYQGCSDVDKLADWNKAEPYGVNKWDHYQTFLSVIELAKAKIYKRTQKFWPNYLVVAPDVMEVLTYVKDFIPVKNPKMNGPFKVGEIGPVKVYVSPKLETGEYFFGLNGSDMMSSAGVYAPYMAIVPTQLLGTPDGGLAQGFSTWYAKALLNDALLVKGKIIDDPAARVVNTKASA